jgi:GAF domain-containing protein
MMNKHFEKPKTRRKTASPKSRNKPKTQQRTGGKMTGAKTLEEARRQLSALAEVLSAISGSKFELQPVLDRVVQTAARLCRARQALIFRFEDGVYRFAAGYSISPAYSEIERRSQIAPGPGTLVGRAAMARRAVRIDDAWTDPLYERKEDAKVGRHRSMLGVPLLRDGEPIGVIGLSRSRVDPFSAREIELVTTFANQAVIAIESVRLFEAEQQRTRELTESLEQQSAAAEVLQVISRSQGELEPVFATMLEKAVRICGATFGNIYRWDGDALHIVATHNTPPAFAEERKRSPYRPAPNSPVGRMVAAKTPMHVRDVMAEDAYLARRDSGAVAAVELGGARTVLSVPLLDKGEMTGAFFLCRQHVQSFTDKQIKVVQHFATQAVIAIENARLLNELRERTADLTEALGQQKAITGVLQLLSDSSGKLEPIFQAILENAVNICRAHFGNMFLYEDGAFRGVAMFNAPEPYVRARMLGPT